MKISPITSSHWQQIERIQHLAYDDDLPESITVLKSKVAISPQTCFVCIDEQQIVGYLISHPYHRGSTPKLHQISTAIDSAHLHLHDLAITPTAQGQGLPKLLLNHLFTILSTMDYQSVSLISVQDSMKFWQKYNFVIDKNLTPPTNYGDNAVCMYRAI
ncbi:GNAT family N-acetyltransferase [Photobacterium iliopiscarium]|jgi:ribosomal protein S18 acetylase RimI-like enzyme|uniref:GNAT family N-acetyltransferase n=1 Tax=Photobacterium iliopiscarium TaxID=56192 RepID=A0A2T3MKS2_9GAMM|nr:GNAT family N-acetyltransferase [Photobacterium iliopiscarium]PST96383.1 GNAT family N-acetyltransferase [Photobacterium iliopiscarium]PSU00087.1 GNAT family N-acetyltransferase [Photobacterium iliopiscarium]PSV85289.1 GNAT family N-acetyltransferase [Photobacterium iliopiscarium]PSV96864.1 GNAT family N-acetyltransferase [Photobacterium iliopiscarium]PSW99770.1 GNAT family N-acetyltransferase [Photobacterium iliopiscarium]